MVESHSLARDPRKLRTDCFTLEFRTPRLHAPAMNTLLPFAVVQAFTLVVFAWFNWGALFRILALRPQLGVYKRKAKKPRLRNSDRLF